MGAIARVEVRDFQSLKDVELDLGRLTVVVGASNSGKSAVIRALRAVATNVTSPSTIVRHGAKKAVVRVDIDDTTVQLERGASLSRYALEVPDLEPAVFAKAGTGVPEDVLALTRFSSVEGEDLNFALQFDRPFLLDSPSTKVAKVLGDLTGINRIFDAVREANRRRLEVGSKLKVRRGDVEELRERAAVYADLPAQRERVTEASRLYWEAVAADTRSRALSAQVSAVHVAGEAIEALEALPPLPEVSFDGIDERLARLNDLARLLSTREDADAEIGLAQEAVVAAAVEVDRLDVRYAEMLKEAGTCPTCLRPT